MNGVSKIDAATVFLPVTEASRLGSVASAHLAWPLGLGRRRLVVLLFPGNVGVPGVCFGVFLVHVIVPFFEARLIPGGISNLREKGATIKAGDLPRRRAIGYNRAPKSEQVSVIE